MTTNPAPTSAQLAQQGNRNPDGTYRTSALAENAAESLTRDTTVITVDFAALDAELDNLDDSTEAGSARMFELAAAATSALARDAYPDAAAVILEDVNDEEGASPFFYVCAIKNAAGDTLWNGEDNDDLVDSFAEYALMLDRDLGKIEVVDRRQGLSKLTLQPQFAPQRSVSRSLANLRCWKSGLLNIKLTIAP